MQHHVQEYHSGFTYICKGCNRSFTRRNYNHRYKKPEIKLQDFDIVSPDGCRGDEGFAKYRDCERTMLNKLIVKDGGVWTENGEKKHQWQRGEKQGKMKQTKRWGRNVEKRRKEGIDKVIESRRNISNEPKENHRTCENVERTRKRKK